MGLTQDQVDELVQLLFAVKALKWILVGSFPIILTSLGLLFKLGKKIVENQRLAKREEHEIMCAIRDSLVGLKDEVTEVKNKVVSLEGELSFTQNFITDRNAK